MLPTRIPITDGQALDCYLEHLAAANGYETSSLLTILRNHLPAGEPINFLTLAPSQAVLAAISALSGQPTTALTTGTQASLNPAIPANLHTLDHTRPSSSYRALAAKGWLLGHGTQACPDCLATTGRWQTRWMLYATIGCTRHHRHLIATCPACGQQLRSTRHSPLRPHGASTSCQNPHDVRDMHCLNNLAATTTPALTPETATYQAALDHLLDGNHGTILGRTVPPVTWTAEHRALASLICHIATHTPDSTSPWQAALLDEARHRTDQRGPRWGLTPPASPWVRGQALAEAHRILTRDDTDSAAGALQPWILRIPTSTEALTTWIRDRLPANQHASDLTERAAIIRRRPGQRIAALDLPELQPDQIPWIIPETLAARHLPALPGVTNRTRNAYAALCLARQLRDVTTWAQAAEVLGLPGASGIATARLCSAPMRTHGDTFATGLNTLARHLATAPTWTPT